MSGFYAPGGLTELLAPIEIGPELAGTSAGSHCWRRAPRVRQARGEDALARAGLRVCGEACEPLCRGLELGPEARAEPLVAHAREELLAAGARPRRAWLGARGELPAALASRTEG